MGLSIQANPGSPFKPCVALAKVLSWIQSQPEAPGCQFHPWSGHIQGVTCECMAEWRNKATFVSLSVSLESINFLKILSIFSIRLFLISEGK